MKRSTRHRVIAALVSIGISILMFEGLLRLFDPYAYQVRFDNVDFFQHHVRVHEIYGYAVNPGRYEYSRWRITILPDHSRLVPDTRQTDCEIVTLGDSVAFGYGLNDDETLPNYLAQHFPNTTFINAALTGYNSENVRRVYEAHQGSADGFIYLLVDNDAAEMVTLSPAVEIEVEEQLPFLSWYLIHLKTRMRTGLRTYVPMEPNEAQQARFIADTAPLFDDPRVLIAAYGHIPVADNLPVDVQLPIPDERIAPGDMHPNGEGNRKLVGALVPHVEALINEVCHD